MFTCVVEHLDLSNRSTSGIKNEGDNIIFKDFHTSMNKEAHEKTRDYAC